MKRGASWLLAALLTVAFAGAAAAQTPPPDPAAAACTALLRHNFQSVPAAPAWITSATAVTPPAAQPYCEIVAHVAQQVGVELRLPLANWNGKFWMNGNHGLGGQFVIWAYQSPQGKIDFGYRATHVATVAAKAIVTAFYGRPIADAYFGGWSTGGRQALMEAERYPNDFNGIIAGPAPLWSSEMQASSLIWTEKADRDADGRPILPPAKLPLIHDAATKACAGGDGVNDGLISDPRTCHWDPKRLQCSGNVSADTCLTAAQVETARKFYAAPHDRAGHELYAGGMMRGSELLWTERLPYGTSPISRTAEYSLDYLRYLAFAPDAGPRYDLFAFDFDRDPQRLAANARIYDATDPNLRPFRAHGGKLIMFSGWADTAMPPLATLKFYQQIVAASGGPAVARSFVQLYLVPGQYHGPEGVGPVVATTDFLAPLEAWVETNVVPDHVIAAETRDGAVSRTRPVYPYPLVAHYRGSGDPNDAANFSAGR